MNLILKFTHAVPSAAGEEKSVLPIVFGAAIQDGFFYLISKVKEEFALVFRRHPVVNQVVGFDSDSEMPGEYLRMRKGQECIVDHDDFRQPISRRVEKRVVRLGNYDSNFVLGQLLTPSAAMNGDQSASVRKVG